MDKGNSASADLESKLRALHDGICPYEAGGHETYGGCVDPACPDRLAIRAAADLALEAAGKAVAQLECLGRSDFEKGATFGQERAGAAIRALRTRGGSGVG